MDRNSIVVLKYCIKSARKGAAKIDVFDLIYETSIPYIILKDSLNYLVSQNELEEINLKTYKFIGDINRELDEPERQKEKSIESQKSDIDESKQLDDRRAYLEKRRQELIRKMQQEQSEAVDKDINIESNDSKEAEKDSELIDFVKEVLLEKLKHNAYVEVPVCPSWESKDEFLQFVAENIIDVINSDKQMGKLKAIKKAKLLLGELHRRRNRKMIEIYEYIIFSLQNMSNYHYNRIREKLL